MLSRLVQRMRQDAFQVQSESANGQIQSVATFAIDRASSANIPDTSKLPVLENNTRLQNDDGELYFLFDYSAWDGPDIFA